MELKEFVETALEKIEDRIAKDQKAKRLLAKERMVEESLKEDVTLDSKEEEIFLKHIRERLLVMFEALQSDDVVKLENKVDITLNYMEYLLSVIEDRLEKKRVE